jgi:hypothetical protein
LQRYNLTNQKYIGCDIESSKWKLEAAYCWSDKAVSWQLWNCVNNSSFTLNSWGLQIKCTKSHNLLLLLIL